MFDIKKKLYSGICNSSFLEIIAYLLPFMIIVSISVSLMWFFIIGKGFTAIKGSLMLGLPAVMASLFLIVLYKCKYFLLESLSTVKIGMKYPILFFSLLYCLSILVLLTNPKRPFSYFVLMTIIYSVIFIQIMSEKSITNLILAEIILCMLNLIYGVVFQYPLYYGYTDTFFHMFYATVTYLSGSVIPADLSLPYTNYPLFHILIAQSSYLLGTSIQSSMFLITAPIFSILVIFIYYIFYRTIDNSKISLLACMLFSVNSVVIFYGLYIITRTMAFISFIIILFLIYAKIDEVRKRLLILIMSFFLLLVHQVSFPQILFLLFVLVGCQQITQKKWYLRYDYLKYLTIIFISYLFFVASTFASQLFETYSHSEIYDSVIIQEGITITGYTSSRFYSNMINYCDLSIFIFFSLIGIGYLLLNSKKNQYSSVFALFTLLMLPVFIPNPLQSLWQTMTMFRFDRFMLLVSPFMVFMMSCGIFTFFEYNSQKKSINKYALVLLIIILLSTFTFVSITKDVRDSNVLSSHLPRSYFTEGELIGFNHVLSFIPFGSELYSDESAQRFFSSKQAFNASDAWKLPYYNANEINSPTDLSKYHGYFVMRDDAFNESGIFIGAGGKNLYINSMENQNLFTSHLNRGYKIYSSLHVSIFLRE